MRSKKPPESAHFTGVVPGWCHRKWALDTA
jgi:hypothetical protein